MKSTLKIYKDGTKIWKNDHGLWHREDGPAVICSNGEKYWYLNHAELTEEKHAFCVKHNISFDDDYNTVFPSEEIKVKYLLIFG